MSRITKQIAEAVAKALLEQKSNELKELNILLTQQVRSFYIKSIPQGVLDLYAGSPKWFKEVSSIRLTGVGISDMYHYYSIGDSLPNPANIIFNLNDKQAEIVASLDSQISDKKKKINELKANIEVALYNLRTYKNVEKEFPEAFKLLPEIAYNTSLAINIKDIRCKLDKANC
jgi:hypothetical protein